MNLTETEDLHSMGVYPKRNVQIVSGRAEFLYDTSGREYVDCVGGHGVAIVGHAHPRVVGAIHEQSSRLIHCPEIFYNDVRAKLLERLTNVVPKPLGKAFLCNSGAEAVEAAIKLARAHTGRKEIIAAMNAFHGRTMGALSLTWKKHYRERFEPLIPGVKHVRFGNAAEIRNAITGDTAAVVLEPIQGEAGVRIPPSGYLREVREICDEKGVLLVLDEVQTGFGRTGRMFACEHENVVPDIICLAKGIAGGVPMGAIVAREEVCTFRKLEHGSTFGGNPLACAAALAAIDTIVEEKLPQRAAESGKYFLEKLKQFEGRKGVVEARGKGLMLALEFSRSVKEMPPACAERGLLVLTAGDTIMRFLPPLIIRKESIDRAIRALDEVIQ